MDLFPKDEVEEDPTAAKEPRLSTTVRLRAKDQLDVEFIVRVWNERDRALGIKRKRKWSEASVMQDLVERSLAEFWKKSATGRVDDDEGRERLRRRLVSEAVAAGNQRKK